MSLFVYGSLTAMVAAVGWALYGDQLRAALAGSGKRRFTFENATEAEKTIKGLRIKLAAAEKRACPNCHHSPGWPTGAEVADSDRSDDAPTIHADAPVDAGCRDTPLANADTQPVDVRDLREAMGMGRTHQFAAVSKVEPVPRVTWGVKDIPAGPGSTAPTELSPATGRRATVRVSEALDEAS